VKYRNGHRQAETAIDVGQVLAHPLGGTVGDRGRVGVMPSTHGYSSASPYTDDDEAITTGAPPASTLLEYTLGGNEVVVHVTGERLAEAGAHACLCGEMEHDRSVGEDPIEWGIDEVGLDQVEPGRVAQRRGWPPCRVA
jgi:hypothetical protein